MTTYLALAIFALTYLVLASQKIPYLHLDRPSGALAGSVLMVIAGVLTLNEAYQAINYDTITLLLGMMILVGYLRFARFFRYVTYLLLTRLHTGTQLLAGIIIASGLLSAIFVNDTICLMMTPLVVQLCEETKLDLTPFLIALATASNLGSVMTLVGNPQNMLVGIYSGWSYGGFFLRLLPIGLSGLALDVEKMFVPLKAFFGNSLWQQLGVFSAVSIFFSNLVSNVPFVVIAAHWLDAFSDPKTMWLALAMASTFAGNLTIVGSVATMIVMELSRDHARVPFWTFCKIGAPLTLLSTATGVVILGLYAWLGI